MCDEKDVSTITAALLVGCYGSLDFKMSNEKTACLTFDCNWLIVSIQRQLIHPRGKRDMQRKSVYLDGSL